MILVDSRVGSHDLAVPLEKMGLPVYWNIDKDGKHTLPELPFGDVAFQGKGPSGTILDIGIELKRLSDLVGSLRSGRLAGHQLPGLREAYDHYWLIVEGYWRVNAAGQVVVYKRGWRPLPGNMLASELQKQVLTLELCGGFHVRWTNTRRDTLQFIASMYRWWQDTPMDKHKSHLAVHKTPSFLPVTKQQAALMGLPDVGRKVALAAEKQFGSLRRACNAGVNEWAGLTTKDDRGKTRRLGTKAASNIVAFCEGRT